MSALATIAVLSVPAPSLACKCAPPPSATEALKHATAVFEAQVTELSPTTDEFEVSMRVVRAWKGAPGETVRVRTRRETAACGIEFEAGKSYLVYATQTTTPNSAIALEALRCGRTRPAEEAGEDFAELGLGVVPVSPREPATEGQASPAAANSQPGTEAATKPVNPAAGGCASCSAGGAGGQAPPGFGWLALASLLVLVAAVTRRALRPHKR